MHLPAGRVAVILNRFESEPAVLDATALEQARRQTVGQPGFQISRGLRFIQPLHHLPVDIQGVALHHPAENVLIAVQRMQEVLQLRNRPVLHREAEFHLRDFGVLLRRFRLCHGCLRVRQPAPFNQHRPERFQQRIVIAYDASVALNRQAADPVGAGRCT